MFVNHLISRRRLGSLSIPLFSWRASLGLLALFGFISQLRAIAVVMTLLESKRPFSVGWQFFSQATGALGVWLACPVALFMVSRLPKPKRGLLPFILAHLGGFLIFSLAQMHFMFALRALFGPPLGLPGWPKAWLSAASWEIQQNVVVYGGVVVLIALLFAWEEGRRIELNAARLDVEVATSRLDALTSRVDPHFLFNTLNTVSQEMFRDPQVAERLISSLSDILRATLEQSGPTWTLREECAHVRRYLEILAARFGERLVVHLPDPGHLEPAQVPRFSLQSIVENSVKHNADRLVPLHVEVSFHQEPLGLHFRVEDDGIGFPQNALPKGRGLDRLGETLRLLQGQSTLKCSAGSSGGARVEFWTRAN